MKCLALVLLFAAAISAVPSAKNPTLPAKKTVAAGIDSRIVNGDDAGPGQFPWAALLIINGNVLCGGALIGDSWVLTAAHCAKAGQTFSVRLGSTVMNGDDSDRVVVETTEAIIHENYDPDGTGLLNYDVALLKFPNPVSINDKVKPITLSTQELGGGVEVVPMGWGGISEGGPISNTLRYTTMQTITNDECARTWTIFEGQICTKFPDGKVQGTCGGDSGGPLVRDAFGGNPVHEGVVSFGGGCEANLPQGFGRTSYFRDWIRDKTGI